MSAKKKQLNWVHFNCGGTQINGTNKCQVNEQGLCDPCFCKNSKG